MNDVYDDIELEKALIDKRHKELLIAIKNLSLLNKNEGDSKIAEVLSTNQRILNGYLAKLQDLTKPDINVETNQAEVVKELKVMASELKSSFDGMKYEFERQKEWTFTIQRGYGNLIESVTAKSKLK